MFFRSVNEDDVARVVRREYPGAAVDGILELIAAVDVRERPRVVLACLKIADGNLARLRRGLAAASDTIEGF
jgi:hypothetical protein